MPPEEETLTGLTKGPFSDSNDDGDITSSSCTACSYGYNKSKTTELCVVSVTYFMWNCFNFDLVE